jgi:hypothetical protein
MPFQVNDVIAPANWPDVLIVSGLPKTEALIAASPYDWERASPIAANENIGNSRCAFFIVFFLLWSGFGSGVASDRGTMFLLI